jgi:putative ATP-dependent endonuclease of OLD family
MGEHDIDSTAEAVIYCIEEPEAHLHPHQQRKFAKYLVENLSGQVIVTTHSPQIVERFSPNNIIRLCNSNGATVAASGGCSKTIEEAWNDFGYRMSIIPAETFFADAVFLVEGPSEEILYKALAHAQGIDLDYLNISILQVGGVAFSVYARILRAMNIPFAVRTDNDITKSRTPGKWILSGLNRGRGLIGLNNLPNENEQISPEDICKKYNVELEILRRNGIFISHRDLEHDIAEIVPEELCNYFDVTSVEDAVQKMQESKAINMNDFIMKNKGVLSKHCFREHDLFAPLQFLVDASGFQGDKREP